jgi:hypothetical protein
MALDIDSMSVLDRRRIEAMVLGPVIRAFQGEFGEERTNGIVRGVMEGIAREQGRELAERVGDDGLESMSASKGAWRRNNALETEELAGDAHRYEFNVTRCRYAEMYQEIGYGDLGALLSCARDFAFSEGFNPNIVLERRHTIMSGDPICDFRYRVGPSDGSGEVDSGHGASEKL